MKAEAKLESGEVDLVKWLPLFAGDVIAQLMFGESFHMMEKQRPDEMLLSTAAGANMFAYTFPWIYNVLKHIPYPKLQDFFGGNKILIQRGKLAVENSKAKSHAKDIFAKVLADAERDDPVLTEEEVVMQAGIFIFAGTDTTATTLTYLIWAVLSNPSTQKALEDEVAAVDEPYSDEELESLPILNAVIKESLRLYGAAPATLPRVTPPGGAILGGHEIPEGTTVATQAWTMHRDPTVFPDPEAFVYTRWLGGLATREEVKAVWTPFGAGSRICIGSSLAYMELRLATTAFFRKCPGARLAASTTPESMEVENIFLISPRGGACKVVIPTD